MLTIDVDVIGDDGPQEKDGELVDEMVELCCDLLRSVRLRRATTLLLWTFVGKIIAAADRRKDLALDWRLVRRTKFL